MKKLGLAIVGAGRASRGIHLPHWQYEPVAARYELTGVYDLDADRARGLGDELGIRTYGAMDEMLDDARVDLVVVITKPPSAHAAVAIPALEAGKHVLVEKPMCATVDEGRRMIAAARENHVLLTVHQNRRWEHGFLAAQHLLRSGRLGRLLYVHSCTGSNGMHNDLLIDWGIHLLDQAIQLAGGTPTAVIGWTAHPQECLTASGSWKAEVLFDNGVWAEVAQMYGLSDHTARLYFHGDQAVATIPGAAGWSFEPELELAIPACMAGKGEVLHPAETVRVPHPTFYECLYDSITTGAELRVKPEDALMAIRVQQKVVESIQSGHALVPVA